jgi:hypothetical protein
MCAPYLDKQVVQTIATGDLSATIVGALAENPPQTPIGTTRPNVPAHQFAIDSSGTFYILTISGMTRVPLTVSGASRPQLNTANPSS